MRIVSLLPSATEMVWELGIEDRLVAISHECDVPDSVQHLPRITGSILPPGLGQAEINTRVAEAVAQGEPLYTVNGALLRELEPDLVLTQGLCDVCAVTPETIEASLRGVSCTLPESTTLLSLEGTRFKEILDDLVTIAAHTGREEVAAQRIAQARARWTGIAAPNSPKRVLLLEWVEPPYSPGHWVPEQIHAAGLQSAIGSPGDHSRPLPWEEIREAAPEGIGVISCGFGLEENLVWARKLADQPALKSWFTGPVVAFDANRSFSRPTLRIVDGAEQLHRAFEKGEQEGPGFRRV
jgi:iron complex transport system substrate-binding protein